MDSFNSQVTSFKLADNSVGKSAAPVSQRSWVRTPLKPDFFFQALLNVDYKMATKTFALRLKKFLPQIIRNSQTGYIEGRFIGQL